MQNYISKNRSFQTLVEAISKTTDFPVCIWVPDEQDRVLRIGVSVALPPDFIRDATLVLSEEGVVQKSFSTGQITVARDMLHTPWQKNQVAQQTGWKSVLCVPVKVDRDIIGVLSIYAFTIREFSELEKNLLEDYVSQVMLSEEMRGEAVAARQLATLGTVMAALQHRINNTFNIIVPNVTRLRRRVDVTDETLAEILDIIERNARYTSDIIKRIQEPLREGVKQEVNINAVIDVVVGGAIEDWAKVVVTLDLDDSIPLVKVPIAQVSEVFRNLVDNACRAMKGNGQLVVTSCLDDNIVSVRVQDTGPGIPPRIQERLFVKPVPSKEQGGGSGLGLWLSQLMLRTIGGDIKIDKSDSDGTTMLVRIPVSVAGGGEDARL